ncbi:MAG: PhzF family phenazine biosynthesis protein [Rubrivivax sp.]|nr:PhzF family phenazine biosynthesis protein [Rubrivivax sp.]
MKRRFHQVDVFGAAPMHGNPLAVVHDADGLSDADMAAFARWMNLSETTFVLAPADPAADYRVRIFTPNVELPFAGHPTLGTAWAWLAAGGQPRHPERLVQQCGVGLVALRRTPQLAFEAPPLRRSGPLAPDVLAQACRAIGVAEAEVQRHGWVDNGPPWSALMLRSAAAVRALRPDWDALGELDLGVVGAHPPGQATQFEVRAFIGRGRFEDPVTGSLNAGLALWLIAAGLAPEAYVAGQGHALQRDGRVTLAREGGSVWVGGAVALVVEGTVDL